MLSGPAPHDDRHSARRATSSQWRRKRLTVGAAAVLVMALAIFAVAAVAQKGGGTRARRAAKGPTPAARPSRSTPSSATAGRDGTTAGAPSAEIRRLIALGMPIYCGGTRGNEVAFTFDDGPGPYTHYAVKKLTQAHERATFFVVGRSANNYPGWLPRELGVAAIGDHTDTHPVLPELPPAEIKSQIARTKQLIESQTGRPVELFRPPYGAHNATVDAIAKRLGLLEILWSQDSADSLGANWAGIIRNVEEDLRPGAIILMHENRGQTIRALTTLLPELARRHLRSVSVPALLASDPPSAAQVRRGLSGCGQAGNEPALSGG